MEQLDQSLFKIYSYGIVADNKALTSRIINAMPIEITSMMDGDIASNPTPLDSKGVDKDGTAYTTSIVNDSVIECTWLPFGSNRVTPPDVRRGEPVLIWNYDSTDKYYWSSPGLRDDLRRLETVVYAINANPNPASKEFNPDDCYFVEVSSHSKQITLRTSKVNGEPFSYTFQFNTKEGKVALADDVGNFLELNSEELTWKMELNTGTKVHLDKMNLLAEAIDELKCKVGETTITMTPASIINKCGSTEMSWLPSSTILKSGSFTGVRV